MTWSSRTVSCAVLGTLLTACSSGSSGPSCSFSDPAVLPTAPATPGLVSAAPWSKFRYDRQNTGTIVDAQVYDALAHNSGQRLWMFEPPQPTAVPSPVSKPPAFAASPVLNSSETLIYIGNTNGRLYAVRTADGTQDTGFNFALSEVVPSITSTALVAIRDGTDAVFVGGGDGRIYAITSTGDAQNSNWPFLSTGFVSAAPTLGSDGTVYAGSIAGIFNGVCPNGIFRFTISTATVRSPAAITPDGVVIYGADDGQLRAVVSTGVFEWVFAATAPIVTAPVVEAEGDVTIAIYVADTGGRIFKVNPNGQPISFSFPPVGPIASSPALTRDRLYVGSDDGNLYAVDKITGMVQWMFPTGGAIRSSPAVVSNGPDGTEPLIVVGSNDGNVYFVRDSGTVATEFIPPFALAAQHDDHCAPLPTPQPDSQCAVRTSPAIGSDGTVYIGADDGRLYAIR